MKYLIWPLLFIMISCSKKTANYTIKGTINDTSLNSNLVGATIDLYKQSQGTSYETLVSSTTTNSEGSYNFTFTRDKAEKYILKISKLNYFSTEETITVASLTLEKDNIRDYSLSAKAWVKLHFKNTDPQPEDVLRFMKQKGKINCDECCASDYQYLYGAVDTSIYCINDGNTTYSYIYAVLGTLNQDIKSVISTPFDTTEIYLEY